MHFLQPMRQIQLPQFFLRASRRLQLLHGWRNQQVDQCHLTEMRSGFGQCLQKGVKQQKYSTESAIESEGVSLRSVVFRASANDTRTFRPPIFAPCMDSAALQGSMALTGQL